MNASKYLMDELGLKLTKEQIAAIDERMKVKGVKREEKKFALSDDPAIKEKIQGVKTNQAKILAMALLKTKEPVDQNGWAELAIKEGLSTKQDPVRIVAYYKKDLVNAGIVREV